MKHGVRWKWRDRLSAACRAALPMVVLGAALAGMPLPVGDARPASAIGKAEPSVLTVAGKDGSARQYTLTDIRTGFPQYVGFAGFQDSIGRQFGPWGVRGVALTDLLAEAGYDASGDVRVVASDGYEMSLPPKAVGDPWWFFAWYQLGDTAVFKPPKTADDSVPWGPDEPRIILAYDVNHGLPGDPSYEAGWTPTDGGPLRLWVAYRTYRVPPLLMDGYWSVRGVDRLRVEAAQTKEWSVSLIGPAGRVRLTRSRFARCYARHGRTVRVGRARYQGVPLSRLVGMVDDGRYPDVDGRFNVRLARKGYKVDLRSKDRRRTIGSGLIAARTGSIIVAWKKDGKDLSAGRGPLWLQGGGLTGRQRISGIRSITLRGVPRR